MAADREHAPQNIYDDPEFFRGYSALRQNDSGLNGALEVPALQSLLPDLAGRDVLDLGCGFGDFARQARSAGAASVLAVDVSEKMLEAAARLTDDAGITYLRTSIEAFAPARRSADVAVSSLALHYVADYAVAAGRVFDALRPGGRFVFSVEHPVATANPVGWARDGDAVLHWPLDNYGDEGPRETAWFVDGVVKHHRTVSAYVNGLLDCGFRLDRLAEPGPSAAALAARPELAKERRRPPFLLLAASRPA